MEVTGSTECGHPCQGLGVRLQGDHWMEGLSIPCLFFFFQFDGWMAGWVGGWAGGRKTNIWINGVMDVVKSLRHPYLGICSHVGK
jgi:hypothetical protein